MTSSSSVAARPATRRRSVPRSSAHGPSASSVSPRSADVCPRRLHPDEGLGADAHALHAARGKRRSSASSPRSRRWTSPAAAVEGRGREADDGWRGHAVQGVRRRVGLGTGRFTGGDNAGGRRRGGHHVPQRHRDHRVVSDATADPGSRLPRCVDSTGLLAQTEVPRRLVVLGGGIIGCEFASIFNRFGSEVTIVEMLDTLIPQEDEDAARSWRRRSSAARSASTSASSARRSTTSARTSSSTSARARRSSAT